jgi:galactosylceramidase
MRANTPWSGHYEVQPALWATAHTTQFAAPGWKYLEGGACGYLAANGSYVTLQSPNGSDYSIIVETLDAARRKDVTFRLAGGLSLMPVQVWRSDAQEQFVRANQVIPTNGVFQIAFDPGCIYSLTTTTGQRKGDAIGARPAPFPAPYREDFESYAPGATPRYFSDQAGIFEVVRRPDSQGNSLRQVVDEKGIEWHYHANPFPETFLGSTEWTDYEVSVEVLLEKGGFASLFGRVYRIPQNANPPDGYWLVVDHSGAWGLSAGATPIATGKAAFSPETWHTLKLSFMYSIVQVSIDGAAVAELIDGTYAYGMVGLGCGWHTAQFDNLLVRPMR